MKKNRNKIEDKNVCFGRFRMATTLKKVAADKKRSEALPLGVRSATRDIETETRLADYENQISKLQEENKLLKNRLVVAHQQSQQMRKSSTMYEDIPSRIDTVNSNSF